jgi:nitroimidazol reductase NimA-like FMN-containing flavoprotein (pyridoxamine 5'-phosphate oxidase superfamily)
MEENRNFRSMRRFKQALSRQECESILANAYRGCLSVNGDDGYPYTIPVNFIYIDGHIYFHSAVSGYKMDAICRDSKACFMVMDEPVREENDWWFHVRSVICFGRITVLDHAEERLAKLRQFGEKYFPEGYDIDAELKQHAHHTVVLDFSIEHMSGKRVKEN